MLFFTRVALVTVSFHCDRNLKAPAHVQLKALAPSRTKNTLVRIVKGPLFTQSLPTEGGPTQSPLPRASDLETASVALKELVKEIL